MRNENQIKTNSVIGAHTHVLETKVGFCAC